MPACSSTCSGLMTVAAVSGSARWLSALGDDDDDDDNELT